MIETLPSGTVLHGRYRVERVLGSGGFGHVYLAIDLVTSQQYALKEYLVTGVSGQEQLQHEANVLSQLHHPNLPSIHDAFSERGRYYVALTYIEGNDLTDIIRIARQRNEVIPIPRIMGWILAICDAVLFLHSQRPPVIHRDIKPDNIRITPNGTAILVDLGNAKAAADGVRTLFFIRHQGTPGYAPPEQYPGGSGTDARSDVYALGGTLYFALTAHEPPSVSTRNQFAQQGQPDLPSLQQQLANNPPEESPEANAARQFRLGISKPAKPAPRHLRHLAQLGTLPAELLAQLNRIIQKAMATKPKDRYQYVADFADDLKKVAAALPSQPTTSSRPVDPHSTQPDLPMLYEAMQGAQGNQDIPNRATPSSPPGMPTSPTPHCPRCNTALVSQAAFCPRCGLSLTDIPKTNMTTNAPEANVLTGSSHPASKRTISDEKTIRITPQVRAAKTFMTSPSSSTPSVSSPTVPPPASQNIPSPSNTPSVLNGEIMAAQVSPASFGQVISTPPQTPSLTTGNQTISPPGFSKGLRIVVFIVMVSILLLIILVLVIISQSH